MPDLHLDKSTHSAAPEIQQNENEMIYSSSPKETVGKSPLGEEGAEGRDNNADTRGAYFWQNRYRKQRVIGGGGNRERRQSWTSLHPRSRRPPRRRRTEETSPGSPASPGGRGFSPLGPDSLPLRLWKSPCVGGVPSVLSLVGRREPAGREGGTGERRRGQRLQRAPRGPVTLSFPQRPRRAGHLG
ncbi:hypothetical protein LEMLEM_LOCUS26917 [Lemmus lemmus]